MYAPKTSMNSEQLKIESLPEKTKFFLKNLYNAFGLTKFSHEDAKAIEGADEKYLTSLWVKGYILTSEDGMIISPSVNLVEDEAIDIPED